MFEFDLTYFMHEFDKFRTLYGKVTKDQLDLAHRALRYLFTITVVKDAEEERILRTSYQILSDEWLVYREISKIENEDKIN
jgi:hypothetical protein